MTRKCVRKINVFDRLRDRIKFTDDCWLWTGGVSNRGYGVASYRNRDWLLHRLFYTLMIGPIPEGKGLDHLCRVRNCVNPLHLEPVTNYQNVLRGTAQITHCPKNHEYTIDNTYVYGNLGTRRKCRECHRQESAERRKASKLAES